MKSDQQSCRTLAALLFVAGETRWDPVRPGQTRSDPVRQCNHSENPV